MPARGPKPSARMPHTNAPIAHGLVRRVVRVRPCLYTAPSPSSALNHIIGTRRLGRAQTSGHAPIAARVCSAILPKVVRLRARIKILTNALICINRWERTLLPGLAGKLTALSDHRIRAAGSCVVRARLLRPHIVQFGLLAERWFATSDVARNPRECERRIAMSTGSK